MADTTTKPKLGVISHSINTVVEMFNLMPDSLLIGSIFLYIITQNLSYGVFSIFIFEVILSHKFFSWIFTEIYGPRSNKDVKCRIGYKTPSINIERFFSHNHYPSYGVFSITSVATYLGLSTYKFTETLAQLGSGWEGRNIFAYIFIGIIVLLVIVSRIASECDSFKEIGIALFLALITGSLFFMINYTFFGDESINFLGLPFIQAKESEGKDIYVCSTTSS